VTNRRTN